jgi:bla regulator protein BlaR1
MQGRRLDPSSSALFISSSLWQMRRGQLLIGTVAILAVTMPAGLGLCQAANEQDWEKAAGGKMAFEVASVRLNPGPMAPANFRLSPDDAYGETGGLLIADFPLENYIEFAYKIWPTREESEAIFGHLPKWVQADNYQIRARAAIPNPTKDQMRLMMQSLLKERFGLVVHFETQETPVLEMTLMRPGTLGPQLHRHEDGPACDVKVAPIAGAERKAADIFPSQCGGVEAVPGSNQLILMGSRDTTMEMIAKSFSIGRLGRPVVDATGLSGKYDFTLQWTRDADSFRQGPPTSQDATVSAPQGTSFLDAVKEQLGLRLKPGKAPMKVLGIDHAERPSEN